MFRFLGIGLFGILTACAVESSERIEPVLEKTILTPPTNNGEPSSHDITRAISPDFHSKPTNPNNISCLDYGNSFDCKKQELSCVDSYRNSWQEFCVQDKKYCSVYDWSMFCLQGLYACQANCTASCQYCVDSNSYDFPPYTCKESCQQE